MNSFVTWCVCRISTGRLSLKLQCYLEPCQGLTRFVYCHVYKGDVTDEATLSAEDSGVIRSPASEAFRKYSPRETIFNPSKGYN